VIVMLNVVVGSRRHKQDLELFISSLVHKDGEKNEPLVSKVQIRFLKINRAQDIVTM
jgi:hypothetical protein